MGMISVSAAGDLLTESVSQIQIHYDRYHIVLREHITINVVPRYVVSVSNDIHHMAPL